MTLIELMVAMVIIGLIFALAATGLRSTFNVNLKNASAHLASTLRYLSNKAVTDHLYLRMVFDLDEQTYSVEESAEPFVISTEDTENASSSEKKDGEDKKTFAPTEERILQPAKLPSGVFFKDVSVSFLREKKEKGLIYTYFFPDGYAIPTVINLRDEDDEDHYSIEILPLSGRVKVESQYREMERK